MWSQAGATQCHCVVAFEKFKRVFNRTRIKFHQRPTLSERKTGATWCADQRNYSALRKSAITDGVLPQSWWMLHALDLRLWQEATRDEAFCHFPQPLTEQFRFAPPAR